MCQIASNFFVRLRLSRGAWYTNSCWIFKKVLSGDHRDVFIPEIYDASSAFLMFEKLWPLVLHTVNRRGPEIHVRVVVRVCVIRTQSLVHFHAD